MSNTNHNEPDSKELNKAIRSGKLTPAHDGLYWSDDEKYQLRQLFHEGEDISEISRILQRTERAVVQQLSSLKLFESPNKRSKNKTAKCLCDRCDLGYSCPDYKSNCKHSRKNQSA